MVMQQWLYNLAPEAVVESTVQYLRHTWKFADPYLGAINPAGSDSQYAIWMMQRPVFDQALATQAVRCGATLRDGLAVQTIEAEGDRLRVRAQAIKSTRITTGNGEWSATARYVIGADGANGVTARIANLRSQRAIALGMEIELPHEWGKGHPELRPDIAHLEYGAIPQGYAWVFPKGNHLNVGAGLFNPDHRDPRKNRTTRHLLRQAILDYLTVLQLESDPADLKFYAHPLPIWNGRERLHTTDGRILLAGDAAGLINPFFGDGILHAVKSGVIAGNCVVAGESQSYSDRIHSEFAANFDAAQRMAKFFYRFPHFCYQYGIKHPRATRAGTRLLCGELPFTNLPAHLARRLITQVGDRLRPAG